MHDRKGKPVKVGDVVNVPCVIKSATANADYCNITVETLEPMYPGEHKTTCTLNARQVEATGKEAQTVSASDVGEVPADLLK